MAVPTYDNLFNPTLQALHELGGSGRNEEIEARIAENLKLSDADINDIHLGNRTKLGYRSAWARNYLKRYGLLENSERGVWALTTEGRKVKSVNKEVVVRAVRSYDKNKPSFIEEDEGGAQDSKPDWDETLLNVIKEIEPAAFERLCQRLLRESGFVEVTVEGRSGDGGIDGRGIYKIGSLISIRVIFQAKRYKGSISSQQIREFKGTMTGRDEKGIFITTGTFTREAKQEATREGSVALDLIDGNQLAELLKDLSLGVKVEKVEEITVLEDWFRSI